jgi:hypothetical protein
MPDDGVMWKQAFWFALLGSVLAVLATAVDDVPIRGESFAIYDGGTSLISRYHGSSWSEVGQTAGAGAAVSALIGLVLYGCGIRVVADAGSRVGRVVLAGVLGTTIGLSPVLFMVAAALSGVQTGESWAIEPSSLLTLYGVSAVLAYSAAVIAVHLSLRVTGDELTKRTTRCTALLLPVGAVAATASGVCAAWLYDFSTSGSTLTVVVVVVTLVLSATFAAARSWALGRHPSTAQPA